MRVKRGVTSHKKHKKVIKQAKGMQHNRRSSIKMARDRRNKKRDLRALWITRINAAVREHGLSYSVFMNNMKKANIQVDRKIMSELAVNHPAAIEALVKLK